MPAHVTLLYPFAPDRSQCDIDAVRDIAVATQPFALRAPRRPRVAGRRRLPRATTGRALRRAHAWSRRALSGPPAVRRDPRRRGATRHGRAHGRPDAREPTPPLAWPGRCRSAATRRDLAHARGERPLARTHPLPLSVAESASPRSTVRRRGSGLGSSPRPERLERSVDMLPGRRARRSAASSASSASRRSATCSATRRSGTSARESVSELFGEDEEVAIEVEVLARLEAAAAAAADDRRGDGRRRVGLDPRHLVQPALGRRPARARPPRPADRHRPSRRVRRALPRARGRARRGAARARLPRDARTSRRRSSASSSARHSNRCATCPIRCRPDLKARRALPLKADALARAAPSRARWTRPSRRGRASRSTSSSCSSSGSRDAGRAARTDVAPALGPPGELAVALPRDPPVRADPRPGAGARPRSTPTSCDPCRWSGCSRATSARARPSSRSTRCCAPSSRAGSAR